VTIVAQTDKEEDRQDFAASECHSGFIALSADSLCAGSPEDQIIPETAKDSSRDENVLEVIECQESIGAESQQPSDLPFSNCPDSSTPETINTIPSRPEVDPEIIVCDNDGNY
jgi:hypothetical protein